MEAIFLAPGGISRLFPVPSPALSPHCVCVCGQAVGAKLATRASHIYGYVWLRTYVSEVPPRAIHSNVTTPRCVCSLRTSREFYACQSREHCPGSVPSDGSIIWLPLLFPETIPVVLLLLLLFPLPHQFPRPPFRASYKFASRWEKRDGKGT